MAVMHEKDFSGNDPAIAKAVAGLIKTPAAALEFEIGPRIA
jgi:hypothetical protein